MGQKMKQDKKPQERPTLSKASAASTAEKLRSLEAGDPDLPVLLALALSKYITKKLDKQP